MPCFGMDKKIKRIGVKYGHGKNTERTENRKLL